jgi:hypothetical protein
VDSATDQGDETHAPSQPITTWVLMFLATVITLLLPDWTGSGALYSVWLLSVPVLLGIVGAFFALKVSTDEYLDPSRRSVQRRGFIMGSRRSYAALE